jgi:peroxiredoxin
LSAVGATIERFFEAGIIPFGVNPADAASHRAFMEELDLPFDLLVDEGRRIADAYGAVKEDGSGIQRTVVVVGQGGKILFREAGAPLPGNILQAVKLATQ